MGEMKRIYNMYKDGSYILFLKEYHNALAEERKEFKFRHQLYTIERAEAIELFIKNTISKL